MERQEGVTTVPGSRMAAGQALREALAAATPVVLEPVMRVEITAPEDFLGASITMFTTCGGKVEDYGRPRRAQNPARHCALAPFLRLFHLPAFGHPGPHRAGNDLDRFDLP